MIAHLQHMPAQCVEPSRFVRARQIRTASAPSSGLIARQRNAQPSRRFTIRCTGIELCRLTQQSVALTDHLQRLRRTVPPTIGNQRMMQRCCHDGASANLAPGLMLRSVRAATRSSSASSRLLQHVEQNAETEIAFAPSGEANSQPPTGGPSAKDVRHEAHRGFLLAMFDLQCIVACRQGSRTRAASVLSIST